MMIISFGKGSPRRSFRARSVIGSLAFLAYGANANAANGYAAPDSAARICDAAGFQTVLHAAPAATDARAYWLDSQLAKWPGVAAAGKFKLYFSANGRIVTSRDAKVTGADGALELDVFQDVVPAAVASRFKYVADGVMLSVKDGDRAGLPALLKHQLVLVHEATDGTVRDATALQIAGALDDIYTMAAAIDDLGATVAGGAAFKLWAPTAQRVSVCIYDSGKARASSIDAMRFDAATGVWSAGKSADLSGKYYKYAVDVFVRGEGVVRNLVTDPYSISLTSDSTRSYIANLDAANLKPSIWDAVPAPATVAAQTDMVVYELHVRDFSINDKTVSAAHRGKYAAFSDSGSNGMKHLQALAKAGLTDVHLLPVFDIASVPEKDCVTPMMPRAPADSEAQQSIATANAAGDCFNWGYDPYHYNAPEGSYATDAADGARRILEFRQMVTALHRAGLRVGMDVVYNHTAAAGQKEKSVLDRIVPGYYQRLNASGGAEQSTCCDNTATENLMMGKLMSDSVLLWATKYKIDSFRFDLMAHQPRAVMEAMQARIDAATGRHVNLIGEGWNFGEVADGARFVQASQLSLNGTGIGTFSDRGRDAVRGGSASDAGDALVANQGYINGLVYDPNTLANAKRPVADLQRAADMVRVGLAGSIRDYELNTYPDSVAPLQAIDYNGQPAGYASEPGEVVNYVENHDNHTLFDINVFRLPLATSREDRVRVQMLGAAINAFSQGVAYFHAGIDTLRSKSLDRNSFDSGDWFNRIDWTYRDNYFGTGAPPKRDNGSDYAIIKPLLANSSIKPDAADIAHARDMFRDLLKIRASSSLFRMRTAADIKRRLHFYNTGSQQNPVVIAAHLDGAGYEGANFKSLLYFINVDKAAHDITIAPEQGKSYVLHPVHAAPHAADQRPAASARYDSATGRFYVPARTAIVFVES